MRVFGRLTDFGRRLRRVVATELGRDEAMLLIALGLLSWGCGQVWSPAALLVPGAVLLWIYLPPRVPFVVVSRDPERSRREE